MKPPQNAKPVRAFLKLDSYFHKFINNFPSIARILTVLTHHDAKVDLSHSAAFNTLKSTLLEAPILYYLDPSKSYIVYTDAPDDAFGAQVSQEYSSQELSIAFFSHTFTDTQWKWSTTKHEAPWHLLCCNKVELLSTEI